VSDEHPLSLSIPNPVSVPITSVVEDLVVEIEFLAQTPIPDPLLQAEQACDEGEGLRECSGIHPLISH
jgi:hypothetical protein